MSSSSTFEAAAAAVAPSAEKMVSLRSSDLHLFQVEQKVAFQSQTIKNMVEDCNESSFYPVPNVTADVMAKVLEYCKRHVKAAEEDKDLQGEAAEHEKNNLKEFDTEFMKVEQEMLFELIMAANYLDIKDLLDLSCQTAADMIKDKSPEEVRTIFNIENDFTPEEEEKIRREYPWAFE